MRVSKELEILIEQLQETLIEVRRLEDNVKSLHAACDAADKRAAAVTRDLDALSREHDEATPGTEMSKIDEQAYSHEELLPLASGDVLKFPRGHTAEQVIQGLARSVIFERGERDWARLSWTDRLRDYLAAEAHLRMERDAALKMVRHWKAKHAAAAKVHGFACGDDCKECSNGT